MLSFRKILQLTVGVLGLLALFLSYLYPFHQLPWTTFFNDWLFSVFLGFGFCWVISGGRILLSGLKNFFLLLLLLIIYFFVNFDFSSRWVSLWVVFLTFVSVGWLAYNFGLNLKGTRYFSLVLGVVWLAATVSAVVALLQWGGVVSGANWDPGFILYSEGGGRVSSNIGQANNLGTLLVLGMAVIGFAWYQRAQRSLLWRVVALLSMALLVFGVYFSGSRTATLSLILWPVLFFVWVRWRHQQWPWLVLLPIALIGLLQVAMPPLIDWWGLFPAQEARSLVSDSNRPRLWMMVLKAIGEQPLLGHGFGAVANAHLRHSPEFGAIDFTIAQHAHNTVLDMWVIFGLPLGTVIVGGVLWIWGCAWLKCQSVAEQFVWFMPTAMLTHAMLEFPLHYGFFFWLLCLLLGAFAAKEGLTLNIRNGVLGQLIWLAVFSAFAVPVWYAYVQTESLYTTYRQRGAEATHQLLKELPPTLGQVLYPELYERLYWVTISMDDSLELNDEDLAALEQQASRYPLPTLGWRVAFAQAARGNVEQATWWAERMCRMFDPRVCASAAEEWKRRGAENPKWPALPWEKWLPKSSAAH